jgi:hypothetical protein
VKVPKDLLKLHRDVTLCADIFFVNKIPFFISLSRKIKFTAVNHLPDRKITTIFQAYEEIHIFYYKRGFHITTLLVDNEFAPLQAMIQSMVAGPRVNLTSANEHVPDIERRIRVVKERSRAARHSLPFNRIPKLLTVYIVFTAVKLLNHFPPKGGISDSISPKTIMTGETLDYKKHLNLQLGAYYQVHEDDTPRNSQAARSQGAICLAPSGNLQGGYRFLNLTTGKRITRRTWDIVPMPQTVIDRVNLLGKDQPELFIFTDRKGRPIGDIDITDKANPEDLDDDDHVDIPGVYGDPNQTPPILQTPNAEVHEEEQHVIDNEPQIEVDILPEPNLEAEPEPPALPTVLESVPHEAKLETQPAPEADVIPGVRRSARTRFQTKESYIPSISGSSKYAYAVAQLELQEEAQYDYLLHPDAHMFHQDTSDRCDPDVVACIMTQLSLKAGLKAWGTEAKEAVHSEMKQLHFRDTFKPMHWRDLTHQQRQTILESHMFLKEKRTGKIKGRTVAGGNKQRDYISKEEASSPTVATESVLLTCIIDAEEHRDVAVIDIPNAFIQTRIEEEKDMAIIKIRGILVDMLLDIAPDVYKSYATTDKKGNKQLIVQCLNAIYGTMMASLLYYVKFSKSLLDIGFKFNAYDPCVANKQVNGSQMTICFHVDDCKLSHKNKRSNDRMIKWLKQEYESIFEDGSGEMAISRGKVHTYLGMTLDYTLPGRVKITMFDFLEEVIVAFDKADPKGCGTKTSAAPTDLFKINEDCRKLPPKKSKEFHNIVAKMLYATKRARPDTCTSIAFLTTRVREPDDDDWVKLTHLIQYVRGTKQLPLILSASGTGIVKWWVDGSFAIHPNMRGHTGGGLSMGRGFPIVTSTKQKLNTRSSTESELVSVDDMMPAICWTRYFLLDQGYQVRENIVYQDNESAILLERNGKASSSKRTKHINIRYYFVTDRINQGELTVEWCPTGDMTADFMTKPTQGALFRKFRDQIMGLVKAQSPGPGNKKINQP